MSSDGFVNFSHMDRALQFKDKAEAVRELKKFYKTKKPDIKVGDFIERNEWGMKRFAFPEDNQAAMCVAIIDKKAGFDGKSCADIMVLTAVNKGNYIEVPVDSRYFRVVGSNRTNLLNFMKKEK